MKIFNHDITASTLDTDRGVHLFSGRALGLSEPGDKVQLHPQLQDNWAEIQAHYRQVGLSYSDDIIWDTDFSALSHYPGYQPSVYFFGHALHEQSAYQTLFNKIDSRWAKAVEFINSKNNFIKLAKSLNVPVPATECFDQRKALGNLEAFPFPCYAKLAVADHGVGIFRCENSTDLLAAIEQFPSDKAFQIQQGVTATVFLNLQYRVTDTGLQRSLASEQILEGCVHGGNRYPTAHQPWAVVQPMAEWLYAQGIKGTFAFDVAVVETGDSVEYLAIECNPRFNGSSYPTEIAEQLGIAAWRSKDLYPQGRRKLVDLDWDGLTFDPVTKTGVVLVNWGTITTGKLSVLVAGNRRQQAALVERLERQWVAEPALVG
ncbi:MAG: peptide ligase PGM1-related protein [Cyanobacteria bacterium J06632_22]